MISLPDFAQQVFEMRELQSKYFRTRDPITLSQCKAFERKVDQMVKAVINKVPDEKQLNLF